MQPSPVAGPEAVGLVAAVDAALAGELAARRSEVAVIDARLTEDVDRLIHYLTGGKRLRPQFLCWGYRAAGGLPDGPIDAVDAADNDTADLPGGVLKAAAALELIQACALIHDDVIDRSDTRRGQPSVHRAVQQRHTDHGWSGDAAHFGVSSAVLLGDLALAWADDLFAAGLHELGSPPGALAAWRAMRTEVLAGQLLDLCVGVADSSDPVAAAADAMKVNRYKTAAYTVERPLHLGAALAGAGGATIEALRSYGTSIGVAFQLRDDLLGVFGDPAVTGKPAGDDLIEGKKTVLLATARAALVAEPELLAELDAGVGRPLRPAELAHLAQLIARSGAPEATETQIDELFAAGISALQAAGSDGQNLVAPRAATALRALAVAATARSR